MKSNPLSHLPATRLELARALECTPKQASAILYYYRRRKIVAVTGRRLPNGTIRQGAKSTPVWDLVKPLRRRFPAKPTVLNMRWAPVPATPYEDWAVYVLT